MTAALKTDSSGSSHDGDGALSPEWQQSLDAFVEFQRRHRGTCDATIRNHLRVLRRFSKHVAAAGELVRPGAITTRHIDDFLIGHARPLGRNYTRQSSCSIRVFMRYLAFIGQVPLERPAQVPTPKVYRLAGLPRGLGRDDLRRVLRDIKRCDARGRRQYAVLMLLATYGLRASDVAALRLDDLRWREGTLWIRHSVKTGRPLVLPLTDAVGDALADYLQRDRPRRDHREVFLSLHAPHHPVGRTWVTKIVREALDHAGVALRAGVAAHAFRHGLATRMVRGGVALDVVAKCLDHASTATTELYTKLAIEDLRSVSIDPKAVLS
jgi:site-specific recombinase XerD